MLTIVFTGFLMGLRHALEADHVAAVAALATGTRGAKQTLRLGLAWGLGHTVTIFVVGSVVMMLDAAVPENIAALLESLVGVMLIILGADIVRRMALERIHFHKHHHGGQAHFHAHGHSGESDHEASLHQHRHKRALTLRALLVGTVHGLAGSAALVLLTLGGMNSIGLGFGFMALFGIGSILGMALLSSVIAVPLRLTALRMTWAYNGLTAGVALISIGIGGMLLFDQLPLI
ncbi:MAG: urease accessory protein [Rhodospirillales bacterium]|nr:urease accessory protein [Rhodospirillales bacterium]